jgi:hypothetical protein
MSRIALFSIFFITLFLTAIPPAAANPRPPSEIPELETALRAAAAHSGRSECGDLPALLAQTGFAILRDGTLPWIRQNMKALEPCLIESQRTAGSPDSLLHREFRAYASPAGVNAMCAVLRARLVPPRNLMALRGRTTALKGEEEWKARILMRACIEFAEQLVGYHDAAAVPAIRALSDSLATLPPSLSGPDLYGFRPLLALREDIRRIEDPNVPELMERQGGFSWRLTRSTAEIVGVYRLNWAFRKTYSASWPSRPEVLQEISLGPGSGWLRIHPTQRSLNRVFALLEGGTANWIAPSAGSFRSVSLRVRFADGLLGDLSADESGLVHWQDNTRIQPRALSGWNPTAARAIIRVADTAVLGFVDGDGVSLERRRHEAAPRR